MYTNAFWYNAIYDRSRTKANVAKEEFNVTKNFYSFSYKRISIHSDILIYFNLF